MIGGSQLSTPDHERRSSVGDKILLVNAEKDNKEVADLSLDRNMAHDSE
jgi:hypothetical protein